MRIAPHSVDTWRFADTERQGTRLAERWRAELAIPDGQPVLVYAGKFIPKKDPTLLVQAFGKLSLPAHLVMFGNGELENDLRRAASGNFRVHFRPFQNQVAMPAVYRVGDLFVLPSRGPGETWGLALNEAMASARPVVASSRVGGARDLIAQGANGWIFEAGNQEALIGVLNQGLGMGREGLRRLGLAAQRASEGWTTGIAATKITEAVLSLFQH